MRHVIAKVHFLSNDEGGRAQTIPLMNFGCPVFFDNVPDLSAHGYDCRLLIPEYGSPISPGDTVEQLGLIFLSPEDVLPYLRKGVRFTLWEGKAIAKGEITRIE